MGHQLLLCSSIPHQNYIQTVSTLRALTGVLNPQDISTYTLLTKPHNVFKPKFEPGKVNQIEQFYMKCTTIWADSASEKLDLAVPILKDGPDVLVNRLFNGETVKYWTLQISDIPNAGKNPVLAHNFHESTLVHHHTQRPVKEENVQANGEVENSAKESNKEDDLMEIDGSEAVKDEKIDVNIEQKDPDNAEVATKDSFLQFIEDLGYDMVNQYWLKGIRFFHGDIVIEIFKLFIRDDDGQIIDGKLKLSLLDESNTFQVKAYINFPKGASVDLINQGTKDLTKLKESLKNLFELEVPDRMYMDSRVARVQ